MIEADLTLHTPDGVMGTFLTRPEGDGPWPVVLFLMDAPGKREELHDMARRIATTGYYVLLPNLYYRQTDHFELDFAGNTNRDRMFELMDGLTNAMVVRDAELLLAHADDDPVADAGKVGVVGYCMSGPFALAVAAGHGDRVKAAASVYGVRLAVDADDSPHLGFSETPGELYIACAQDDPYAPPEMVERVTAALVASGNRGTVETYPGTHHGFAFPDRSVYDKAMAERHWERLHALFARNLR